MKLEKHTDEVEISYRRSFLFVCMKGFTHRHPRSVPWTWNGLLW